MAIIVEEESNKMSLITIVTWLAILAIVVAVVYYVFFVTPPLIEVPTPEAFQNINPLSRVSVNPEDVINGQAFQSLKSYVTLPQPGNAGRANPFVPF